MIVIRSVNARKLMAALVFLLPAADSFAENRAEAVSLSAFMGQILMDADRNYSDASMMGGAIGYNIDRKLTLEFSAGRADMKEHTVPGADEDGYINLYRLEGLYHVPELLPLLIPDFEIKELVPYAAAGAGVMQFGTERAGRSTDMDFAAGYGVGLKYFLSRSIAARADVRHVMNFQQYDDVYHNVLYTFGLMLLFGGEQEVEPPPRKIANLPEPPAPKEPEPVKEVAPAPPVVAPPPVVAAAPAAPAPPADGDGDGVPDSQDKCPETPKGVPVDANGCPKPEKAVITKQGTYDFGKIYFDFDKSNIKPVSYPVLNAVVDHMKKYPDVKLEVQGHTDIIGTHKYNIRLSEARSNAVRKYLIAKGIAPARLRAAGYGFTVPVASNRTKQGRAKNRRTEFLPIW